MDAPPRLETLAKDLNAQHRPSSILRRAASVEEVANMIQYAGSEEASATTGAALRVDGGVIDSLAQSPCTPSRLEITMQHPIITAIEERRTTVLFDTSRDIDDAQVDELVRLATRAPTAFNLQNWRFVAVRTAEAKVRLRAVAWNQAKITEAPVTFIVCGRMADAQTLPDRLAPAVAAGIMPAPMVAGWVAGAASLYADQPWRQRDEAVRSASFGATTLFFAAHALGLGAGPMIGFDPEGVAREFGLAADEIPVLLVSVGHGTPENWPQKPRRPLAEVLTVV